MVILFLKKYIFEYFFSLTAMNWYWREEKLLINVFLLIQYHKMSHKYVGGLLYEIYPLNAWSCCCCGIGTTNLYFLIMCLIQRHKITWHCHSVLFCIQMVYDSRNNIRCCQIIRRHNNIMSLTYIVYHWKLFRTFYLEYNFKVSTD